MFIFSHFKILILNPLTMWIKYIIQYLIIRTKNKTVKINYLSFCNIVKFGNYITIGRYNEINNCSVGDFTYTSSNCTINNAKIGKLCSIGSDVKIGLGIHPSRDFVSTHPIFYSTRKQSQISFVKQSLFKETQHVIIGNDVWIGANSIVLDGVEIGNGAIISAGAVVNKNVPPYSIYGGVPAKLIKYRFDEGEIIFLQNLKWWDKDLTWLQENTQYFKDIKTLISKTNKSIK
jgi:acetyltransferase-like isoleucine patch superfamily enzyme